MALFYVPLNDIRMLFVVVFLVVVWLCAPKGARRN